MLLAPLACYWTYWETTFSLYNVYEGHNSGFLLRIAFRNVIRSQRNLNECIQLTFPKLGLKEDVILCLRKPLLKGSNNFER